MEKIHLSPFGDIALQQPKLSIVYDLIATWTSNPPQAHIGRLAAAAIGVCSDGALPEYDIDQARPIAYGGLILDRLLDAGCSPHDIVTEGMKVLTLLAPMLLKEDEVKKK